MIKVNTQQLVRLRIKAGLSQRALAKQTGLSSAYLSQLERGKRNPGPDVAKRICSALGVDFETLFNIKALASTKEATADA